MRKFLVAILLFSAGITYAQVLPTNFHIKSDFKFIPSKDQSGFDQPGRILLRQLAIPVSSPTISSNFISDIIVTGDTIWFGTGKGISRTTDNGNSFQNYYNTAPFGTNDVSAIAVYKNYVVVATSISKNISEQLQNVPTGTGIRVSADYGATWNSYPQPKDYFLTASSTTKIKSPKVAIGTDAIELLDQLVKLVDALAKVVIYAPEGPCAPFGTSQEWPDVEKIKQNINTIKGSL